MAKNYKNDSIVPVDVDKVGVVAAYYDPLCVYVCVCVCVCVCVFHYMGRHFLYSEIHTNWAKVYLKTNSSTQYIQCIRVY